ncbi:21238_t:CDS:2 [Gigaspora margarita]|uniref:21238_t:CDS:1 n=1 Tax=Gigaspora margarita TaxID=4874 RepID=A0ABN7VQS9_GIGMA|nr:21238_t:CDS:2 [Gigaspora margarita]
MNEQPQLFTSGNLVFISDKYVIENLEQCITISYVTITNNENSNHDFNISNIPVYIPHCMISVTVNYKPKEIENYIYFGIKSIEYNSVNGSSAVKMQMMVLYLSQATRFQKYLGTSGSNIKLENIWGNVSAFKSTETLGNASIKIGSSSKEKDNNAQIEDKKHKEDLQSKK